ncbi:methyltransferase domain-containing protein [Novosphingobium sp. 9U]|uniref:methyltransferase domain-containing protein n=1 Tax=Novosphingobium sp. 9U TaxID=2653158 RepID=UPI0012F2B389|nr:methyltransferase domain-containing protein [Novosphingobium sp. 9U]VWX51518.1 Methyltransferase [Novosphingobium sp. 9U]
MASPTPPRIFDPARRIAARRRMLRAQEAPDAPRYLLDDMIEDVLERLAFLRHQPERALLIGDTAGVLGAQLESRGTHVISVEPARGFDEEAPFPVGDFDFIASLSTLDTVNDLPGALVHIRNALKTGGLMIASFPGAGSLPVLRSAMLAADGERPAARIHPLVDVRAGAQLVQRTGFANPVADSRHLDVAFRSFSRAVADLRAQGHSNVLVDRGEPLGKAARAQAEQAYRAAAVDGRTVERFEILTLSGWRG